MSYDKRLIAVKLRHWADYLDAHHLPAWQEIPDIGIYMEQVIRLIDSYLLYLTPEQKPEKYLTSAMVGSFVRKGAMPGPVNKKYYRDHIAYLIMICTLKHFFNIDSMHKIIPPDMDGEKLERFYTAYAHCHLINQQFCTGQIRKLSQDILNSDPTSELSELDTDELITGSAIVSGFSQLLAERLLRIKSYSLDGYEEASSSDSSDEDPGNIIYIRKDEE